MNGRKTEQKLIQLICMLWLLIIVIDLSKQKLKLCVREGNLVYFLKFRHFASAWINNFLFASNKKKCFVFIFNEKVQ